MVTPPLLPAVSWQYTKSIKWNSRNGVVEGDHGAADHGDVHHVPVVSHVGTRVEDESTIKYLKIELFKFLSF